MSYVNHPGGAGVTYTVSHGGAGGGGGIYGPPGTSGVSAKLTVERLEEWQWFQNFMEQNPDVKERFAVHKTYEILKDENTEK